MPVGQQSHLHFSAEPWFISRTKWKKTPKINFALLCIFIFSYCSLWHTVLCVLASIFSAAPLGLEPVSSHSGGSSAPHSPFLPPQVFLFIQAAPRGSYLLQILLPVGLTQPNPAHPRWHPWNHLWGVEPRNQTQFQIPCPPTLRIFPVPCKNLDLLQDRSLLCCCTSSQPSPEVVLNSRTWFQPNPGGTLSSASEQEL